MNSWWRQGISGKADIAVHAHAGRTGGAPPAAFVEKVVVSGMNKDVQLVYLLRDGSEHKADCYFFIWCSIPPVSAHLGRPKTALLD